MVCCHRLGRKGIKLAFLMLAAASQENAHSHIAARVSHRRAIGSSRLQEAPPLSPSQLRSRTGLSSISAGSRGVSAILCKGLP